MCKGKTIFAIAAIIVAGSGAAFADSFTFDMGGDSWIDTSGTVGALEMWANVYDSVQFETYDLDIGESYSFLFAQMGAAESWINDDDLAEGSVTAYVDFDIPAVMGGVDGQTVGFSAGWKQREQGWYLEWDDPVYVAFGNGGLFKLELSDASFVDGLWQGPDGWCDNAYADICARVTLVESPVVPEPATMSLVGLGLAALALRRFRRA